MSRSWPGVLVMSDRARSPNRPHIGRVRRMLNAVGCGLAFAIPVTALAFVVRERFLPVIEFDEAAIEAATGLTRNHEALRTALVAWQEATQPRWVYAVGTLLCLWMWRRHGLRTRALWAFVTMMVAWNLQLLLKVVVQRARPLVSEPVSHAPGYSFPSGHAANMAAACAVIVLLLWPVLNRRGRWAAGISGALLTLLTAFDRIFLGVHFPSDVTAGILFGIGLATASYLGYLGWNPLHPPQQPPS